MTISKKYLLSDKRDGMSKEIEVQIGFPEQKDGLWSCAVRIEKLLDPGTKIVGFDPFQAMILSIRIVDRMLSAEVGHFEVFELDGEKYVKHE